MGYYTNYNMNVVSGDEHIQVIENATTVDGEKVKVVKVTFSARDEIENQIVKLYNYNPFVDECKWYDHEEDMKKISKKFPNHVIELIGEGEESGDLWKKYFKNGKMQKALGRIAYDEFDENKLN